MKKVIHIGIILLCVGFSALFVGGTAHAQFFDDFGGYGDFGYVDFGYSDPCGFGGCGGNFDYGGFEGYSDPCSFGGCGGSFSGVFIQSFGSFGGGCGSFCSGPGFSTVPIIQPYIPPVYNYIPPPIYTPPPVYNSPIYNPPIYNPPTYNPPVYNPPVYTPPPVYNPPVYNPPIYYPPPIYTAPPVYYPPPVYLPPPPPPIVCSVSFAHFNPPLTALPWHMYTYQVYATGNVSGQMSYRIVTGPDGLSINAQTGLISWTPAMNQARGNVYQVTVAAYNGSCENAQTFYVTVNAPAPAPQPKKPAYAPCPPTLMTVTTTPPTSTDTNANANTSSGWLGVAIAGFFGGILAVIGSPITLFLIVVILAILLIRAHRRLRTTEIVI